MKRLPALAIALGLGLLLANCAKKQPAAGPTSPTTAAAPAPAAPITPEAALAAGTTCNPGLWTHVYHGRMATARDRLVVINPCVTVTGTIVNAAREADGDWHIRLKLDPPFTSMLNAFNFSGQHGFLVVEPMCANVVTQADTRAEGVCNGFMQDLFKPTMKNKHVSVTGAFVTDAEHHWNEIHPVSKITVLP
jgi:hypothetical protein